MKVTNIGAPRGANKRAKRRGCGPGSGHGGTSCRGNKGAGQRSGTATWPGFEGGQMPLIRRLPKRGFNSKFKSPYQVVNVESLNRFKKGSSVGPEELKDCGLITSKAKPVKILGDGTLKTDIVLRAHAISKSAEKKFSEAGATFERIKNTANNKKAKAK